MGAKVITLSYSGGVISPHTPLLVPRRRYGTVRRRAALGAALLMLTAKGRDLYPVLLALLQWGDRWFSDERGPPVLLTHRPCGHDLYMVVACSHCGDELRLENSRFTVEPTETQPTK